MQVVALVQVAESVQRVAPLYFVVLEQLYFAGSVDALVRQPDYPEM